MYDSQFTQITPKLAHYFAEKFASPLYIMDCPGIIKRLQDFQTTAKRYYRRCQIGISYKTNPLQGIFAMLHQQGAYAEVVSGIEYQMARRLNVDAENIIFNGPMKTDAELLIAIMDGAYINCDHLEEVKRIEAIAKKHRYQAHIGLRLTLANGWDRFGFSMADNHDANNALHTVNYIHQSAYLTLRGVHSHIGTNIRDLKRFQDMATELNDFAWRLWHELHIQLDYIDVGGGLAGISPRIDEKQFSPHDLPQLEPYIKAIYQPLSDYLERFQSELIFEPGRTLFEPFAALLTQVVGHRPATANNLPALIFDAGINSLATSYVYNHPLHIINNNPAKQLTQLYGPSCNQVDQLHEAILLPALDRGDFLLFYGVGAYCMSFSYSFIRHRPGVIAWWGGEKAHWLRYQENLDYTSRLECVNNVSDFPQMACE